MQKFRPGVSFSDFVVTDFSGFRNKKLDEKPARDFRRGLVVWVGCLLGLFFLWIRLVSLQVLSYDRYKRLADENRLKLLRLPAPRGEILDRNGKALAANEKVFLEEAGLKVEGFRRIYPGREAMAHALGSLGEVSAKELGLLTEKGKYAAKDLIGRTGLEASYEDVLRGENGGWLLEVDHENKVVRDMGRLTPKPGQNLRTTLSLELSKAAYEALGGKKAALVASVPQTGEILALESSPGYDPNSLTEKYEILLADKNLPLFNRAISATYAPGSVFKMPVTVAAIDSGKIKPSFVWNDTGFIQVGSYRYSNWLYTKHGGVEGVVDFSTAIKRSTDTFFYKVGESLGPETMGEYAKRFGFGQKTGIDIGGEAEGLVPSAEWKKLVKGENWYTGNSFHFAIGQDDLLVTPLQVNLMTNILATGGTKCVPHLVNDPNIQLSKHSMANQCQKVQISNAALEIVKKGMVGACSAGGTAFVFFDWNADFSKPKVACKTGTAEYVAENGKMRTHAWFTAFAPADNPQISVTAVFEGGGEGSNVAAPAVRKVLAKYFGIEDKYPYERIRNEIGE